MKYRDVFIDLVNFAVSANLEFDDKGLRRVAWLVFDQQISMDDARELGFLGMFVIRGRSNSESGSTQKWKHEIDSYMKGKEEIYG